MRGSCDWNVLQPPAQLPNQQQTGIGAAKTQVVPTIETAPATKAAEDQQKQDAETQRNLVKYTKWLVIVGSIQFAALILQAIVFVLTLRVTQVNGEKQLRAYICVSKGLLKLDRPESPEAQVYFKNGGLTPAYDVRQWIHIWIEEWPLKVALPMPGEDFQMAASIVPPGGESILILAKEPPVSPQSVHLIGSKVGTVYVYGEIRYTDAFGKKRRTKYRLHFGGQHGGRKGKDALGFPIGYLQPDMEGNEAD